MERGKVWKVDLEPVVGHEQQGERLVIVVSPKPFNDVTGIPIVRPRTNGKRSVLHRGVAVSLEGAGTRTNGVIRCDQPQSLDVAARNGVKLESAPPQLVEEILARLLAILE